MEHISNDQKDHLNQHKNSHKQCDETGHPVVNMMKSQWKLKQQHDQNLPMGGKPLPFQKSRTVRITDWDASRKVNHLSKVIWDRKIISELTRSISSTRVGKPVLKMDLKVSKDKNISRWLDWENLIYVRRKRIKNCAHRQRKLLIQVKEVRHWVQ